MVRKMKESGFASIGQIPTEWSMQKVKNAFYKWMEQNALDIVGRLATTVFFGLTDSGHFVAYIPESWDDITFKTTEYDYSDPCFDEYGHLVLIY